MNIVNKLTLRHLRQNKRRTLVTIIGVVISVAMLTAVATIAVSFLDLMQRQSIADNGEWHVLYMDVDKEQLEAIKNDEATKELIISRDLGFAQLEGSQNDNKPYLFIKEYNTQGFENFPIVLSKGRFPQAANEVVISEDIALNAKVVYEIGDTVTLGVGDRFTTDGEDPFQQGVSLQMENGEITEVLKNEKTVNYTIVGTIKRPMWEPAWAPGYTILSYVDESLIGVEDTVHAAVVFKKVNNSLLAHAEDLAKKNNIESCSYNYNLLRYYGVIGSDDLRTTLFS
ncbi:ABC-type antimicrobial peptide transport system permease subunit [Filibacter limicola]|uniref:ABC-type antimicrobial peptide transport system permease subunit n=1 Tax=Sporosarcina limicola TaxID=34101 RepID=A0A927REB7_9BACL|nr:ABC-type antimicrobial peptide transport system permease subunit [Sporosarcina limicola]